MNKFDTLYEAMSRRDFLKPIKKSNKEPEQVQPTEPVPPKPPAKKPKGMTRRDFIKKTGGGGVLGALTPIDKVIQSWPSIMSQVASNVNWGSIFNTNLIKYGNFLANTGGGQSRNMVGNEGEISGNNIIKSIVHLVPSTPENKDKLHEFSLFNQASKYLDKIKHGNLNSNEKKDLVSIISKMPNMVEMNKQISDDVGVPQNIINTFMNHSEHFEVWEDMFKDILSIGIQNNLINPDTLFKIKDIVSTWGGMFSEVEGAIIKSGFTNNKDALAKDDLSITNNKDAIAKNDLAIANNKDALAKDNESINDPTEEEIKKRHEEYEKHKKEVDEIEKEQKKEIERMRQNRGYRKTAKSIKYSRMDKAGGAEDVGYAKYYEHMKYDALVNKILSEVVGPNAPGGDSLPTPQKDYKWPSGELTPDMLQQIQGKANTPKAIKDIVTDLIMELDKHLENDTTNWKPFVERLLKENKSQSLKDLLESATPQRLKSLANILLLAGKSIFIKLGQEKNAQTANQLHRTVMELFK